MTRTGCSICESRDIAAARNVVRSYAGKQYHLALSRCAGCGFIFLQNDVQIPYDAQYLELEQVITKDDKSARFRAEERVGRIGRFVPPHQGKKFLDIGIGDGLLLSVAESSGYETFGLDVNQNGLDLARRTYGIRASLSLDPLPAAFHGVKFDVIHMNEVIEHVDAPMSLLRPCRKRLNDGGCLVVQTGNIDSLASRIKGDSWDYIRPVHVSYFSTKTLLHAVRRAGFAPLQCTTMDWRPANVLKLMARLVAEGELARALKTFSVYVTALPHGVRRTVLVFAT